MNSRPLTALILSITLIALLLSACQGNPALPRVTAPATPSGLTPSPARTLPPTLTPTTAATSTPVPTPEPDVAQLKGQAIDFWHPWQNEVAQQVDTLAQAFNRSNEWGITVRPRALFSAGALYEAVEQKSAETARKQDAPEVLAAPSDQIATWVQEGSLLVDLTPYLGSPKYGFSTADVQDFLPVFWAVEQANGAQYGIPALRSGRVMFYNQTWAKELGFQTPPATLDEFKRQACAAAVENNSSKNKEKPGTGGWLVDSDPLTMLGWLAAFQANPLPAADGKPYAFESEESDQALAYLHGLFGSGCSWGGRSPQPYDYFANRMALFYTGSLSDIALQAHTQERHKSQDAFLVLPFPSEDGQGTIYSHGYAYTLTQSTPEQQMAAWLFIRWISQPEQQASLARALPSFPVRAQTAALLAADPAGSPAARILTLAGQVSPAPTWPSWRVARRVLGDAASQIYYLTADQLKTLWPQVDETINELLARAETPEKP